VTTLKGLFPAFQPNEHTALSWQKILGCYGREELEDAAERIGQSCERAQPNCADVVRAVEEARELRRVVTRGRQAPLQETRETDWIAHNRDGFYEELSRRMKRQ